MGPYHRIGGTYPTRDAAEMAWGEDNRWESNGEPFHAVGFRAAAGRGLVRVLAARLGSITGAGTKTRQSSAFLRRFS